MLGQHECTNAIYDDETFPYERSFHAGVLRNPLSRCLSFNARPGPSVAMNGADVASMSETGLHHAPERAAAVGSTLRNFPAWNREGGRRRANSAQQRVRAHTGGLPLAKGPCYALAGDNQAGKAGGIRWVSLSCCSLVIAAKASRHLNRTDASCTEGPRRR